MSQMAFAFLEVMARERAEKAERERLESKLRNQDAILKSNVNDLPPENEEWDVIVMGIRLDRHVHGAECEKCTLGCYNHCPKSLPMHWSDMHKQYLVTKVCLKDYFAKCKEWGIKPVLE